MGFTFFNITMLYAVARFDIASMTNWILVLTTIGFSTTTLSLRASSHYTVIYYSHTQPSSWYAIAKHCKDALPILTRGADNSNLLESPIFGDCIAISAIIIQRMRWVFGWSVRRCLQGVFKVPSGCLQVSSMCLQGVCKPSYVAG